MSLFKQRIVCRVIIDHVIQPPTTLNKTNKAVVARENIRWQSDQLT